MARWKVSILALGLLVILLVVAALVVPWRLYAERLVMRRFIEQQERPLLYHLNHEALAAELRRFATEMRWGRPVKHSEPESFDPNDLIMPPALRILKPSAIIIYDDRIEYDFGSALFDFGIAMFKEGVPGTGTKKLGDGIWFYSTDGRVPSE
jgi:hypothetical protein